MMIVAGHLVVAPGKREQYLRGCSDVVRQARAAPGCLDFAISSDLVDQGPINVFERWGSPQAMQAFRSSGPSDEQTATIRSASIAEYRIDTMDPLS
jgi:quinol monooxygenase YgiN